MDMCVRLVCLFQRESLGESVKESLKGTLEAAFKCQAFRISILDSGLPLESYISQSTYL